MVHFGVPPPLAAAATEPGASALLILAVFRRFYGLWFAGFTLLATGLAAGF